MRKMETLSAIRARSRRTLSAHMKLPHLFLTVGAIIPKTCSGQECVVKYWKVVPSDKRCAVYHLPDFDFKSIETPSEAPEHVRRFCKHYEVSSTNGKQHADYCYTGEGDRLGTNFRLGDEIWNFSAPTKDKVFFAGLNFSGCYKNSKAEGIVFGPYDWSTAPSFIERSWPLENRIAKCARR